MHAQDAARAQAPSCESAHTAQRGIGSLRCVGSASGSALGSISSLQTRTCFRTSSDTLTLCIERGLPGEVCSWIIREKARARARCRSRLRGRACAMLLLAQERAFKFDPTQLMVIMQ
eukprot:4793092-Prymnesium_polylepis.2